MINQLDAQYFCFTMSLFHASTCFEHMCSKHVEAWTNLIVKQKCCASGWLNTEINISTCFGQTYCPSSGALILYSQQLLARFRWSSIATSLADSQHNQCDKYQLLWIQCQDSWWRRVSLSETCRVLYRKEVEKSCILLGSIIQIFHDARSSECQTQIQLQL